MHTKLFQYIVEEWNFRIFVSNICRSIKVKHDYCSYVSYNDVIYSDTVCFILNIDIQLGKIMLIELLCSMKINKWWIKLI